VRVLDFAELDAEQLVAQFAGELAGAAAATVTSNFSDLKRRSG
jgi:hypothetical protein